MKEETVQNASLTGLMEQQREYNLIERLYPKLHKQRVV